MSGLIKLGKEVARLTNERNKYKTERDTLIDDLKVLRAKNEELKENNEQLNEIFNYQENKKKEYFNEIVKLEKENKGLKDKEFNLIMENNDLITISSAIEQADDYLRGKIERLEQENGKQLELLQDFSKFINYKLEVSPASDTYKHYRSELDKLGVK